MGGSSGPAVRAVLQTVDRARLLVDNDAEWVETGPGLVVFLSFLKGAAPETVDALVQKLVVVPVIHDPETGRKAPLQSADGAAVLVVPQASLGGKPRGKTIQYHGQCDKELARDLYGAFVERLAAALPGRDVKAGTYGNRQALEVSSSGPFTHLIEL